MSTSVMLFTRDLRVRDNPALAAAALADHVVPLFVFDDAILGRHARNATRMAFLLQSLRDLDARLRQRGGRLVTRRGPWAHAVLEVAERAGAERIHLAQDVSGYASRRLAALESLCAGARREVLTHPGVMVTEPGAISPASQGTGASCSAYQVFTPYYRRWLGEPRRPEAGTPARLAVPGGIAGGRLPALANLAGARPAAGAPPGGETAGRRRLASWARAHLAGYDHARDDLAADATSRLAPYLHFGCLSPRAVAADLGGLPGGEPFVRQLAWRDFFCQLLAAAPDAARLDYRPCARRWHDDQDALAAWQSGQTGFPVVDAAMRQLTSEGFMAGRARMIVASFLTKDLSIDWRAGARHFMRHLADADVACNQLNWQWVAGTGTDTQRHRIFNPTLQGRRFDPAGAYIRRHVPELDGLGPAQVHDPPPQIRRARGYPLPVIDHAAAAAAWRQRRYT
ncbi:MAG TPA: deoxyribodipyrimidine photo-lyase [Streptosporangiaceae bacterium]|nr:deoxyribodipyrimidine photo-lyase [Streptosporangiaceae bacterium]